LVTPGKNDGRVKGTLSYSIRYTPPALEGVLKITVLKANDLANADTVIIGKSDPCVVVVVDDQENARTQVIKNNHNPHWNEALEVSVSGVHTAIKLSVFHHEDDKEIHLGTVSVGTEQIVMDGRIEGTFPLIPNPGDKHVKGTLTFSLEYLKQKK